MNEIPGPADGPPVALVTGGARRIGRAIVEALHGAGFRIALHYRSSGEEARALAARLECSRPASVLLVEGDLLEDSVPPMLVEATIRHFGRLDLLVNNASSFYPSPLEHLSPGQWDDLVGTNLRAPLMLSAAAAPHLRASRGSLVNVADIHGERPLAGHAIYCAAKAGLLMLTRVLALDLAPEARANAVSPGAILWPEGGSEGSRSGQARVLAGIPLGRTGSPEDVGEAVLYLATRAGYVTGHNLVIDGGRLLGA